jgi:hypothetical protein
MKRLPRTREALVLRTDFSDQEIWASICAEIRKPIDYMNFYVDIVFQANIECVEDEAFKDMTKDQLLQLLPDNYEHSFIMIVDRMTISLPEHPLLIVDLLDQPGREFRAIPSEIQGIENNLSIANMFFSEFADHVDEDGIFRGFPEDVNP